MTVNIMEPDGSVGTSIPLLEIEHIETRTLSFFGEKAHSFYLFMKREQGGYFVLLNYKCPLNMEQAKQHLQGALQRKKQEIANPQAQVFELFPSAAPAIGQAEQG